MEADLGAVRGRGLLDSDSANWKILHDVYDKATAEDMNAETNIKQATRDTSASESVN